MNRSQTIQRRESARNDFAFIEMSDPKIIYSYLKLHIKNFTLSVLLPPCTVRKWNYGNMVEKSEIKSNSDCFCANRKEKWFFTGRL
jgi:hypothetical protein